MSQDLHSLAYFSHIAAPLEPDALHEMITSILTSARRKNQSLGLTGALLFSSGCFAQVLEGDLHDVEQLFECIQCDPRHKEVTIVHFHRIETRSFPEWSMAFAGIDDDDRGVAMAAEALGTPNAIVTAPNGAGFVQVLRNLVERHALYSA
jgi:hypothetical protein